LVGWFVGEAGRHVANSLMAREFQKVPAFFASSILFSFAKCVSMAILRAFYKQRLSSTWWLPSRAPVSAVPSSAPDATTHAGLCVARAGVGLGEVVAPSAATDMIARVVPPAERARAVATVFAGLHIGSILGLLAAPPLIAVAGWQSVGLACVCGRAGARGRVVQSRGESALHAEAMKRLGLPW
jgi:MFS family permease